MQPIFLLLIPFSVPFVLYAVLLWTDMASPTRSLNVLGKPLALFSQKPMTGFYRNGYCDVGPEDRGVHAIAAEVTDEFLQFSADRGNDLRSIGLTGGCKWCLCVSRWKEALVASNSGELEESKVPKVFLQSTHSQALEKVGLEDLKKFASDTEWREREL